MVSVWGENLQKMSPDKKNVKQITEVNNCTCAFSKPSEASTNIFLSAHASGPCCKHVMKNFDAFSTSPRAR